MMFPLPCLITGGNVHVGPCQGSPGLNLGLSLLLSARMDEGPRKKTLAIQLTVIVYILKVSNRSNHILTITAITCLDTLW